MAKEKCKRSTYSGELVIGALRIGVKGYSANSTGSLGVDFHQVTPCCKAFVKQNVICSHCEKVQERSKLMRGFEWDGKIKAVDKAVLDKFAESRSNISVVQFCKSDEVPELAIDEKRYFLAPADEKKKGRDNAKPFATLRQSLVESGLVAIGKATFHKTSQIVVLMPYGESIVAVTLKYDDEVRDAPDVAEAKVEAKDVKVMSQIVKAMTKKFSHDSFKNTHENEMKKLIEAILADKEIVVEEKPMSNSDLEAQLKATLKMVEA